ncbi:MAG: hypothetical protein KJ990_12470 [Proteobacteria bacterium]|nr:hypothetical protein [Pseudomonadota bacterium]MBU1648248.1 hypothetical protein [Pseudomonadota bacterium]MBU1986142.1 hypothetical protein [Pseudomonadota bacterium]
MNTYTSRLKKRMPASGDVDWDDEWHDNEKINDVVMGALLTTNRVLSGGEVTDGTGLTADYAALTVLLAGVSYVIAGGSLALTEAAAGAEQANWVFISDSGEAAVSINPPIGEYVPLARVDVSDTAVIRIADLRPMMTDLAGAIHGATSKATPVDADEVSLWDSVTSTIKNLTWANLKATLKTYFDTLYVSVTDGGWIAATLVNSWVTHTAGYELSYKKLANNIVFVTGMIKNGTATAGTTIFTLPVGYRPGRETIAVVRDNATISNINITVLGAVNIATTFSGNSVIKISFSFKAEA